MNTFADKQTLDDLNIPGRHKNNSVARIFDETITPGGAKLLDEMFRNPLTNEAQINERSGIFEYFTARSYSFPVQEEEFSMMEEYLHSGGSRNILAVSKNLLVKKVLQAAAKDDSFDSLKKALTVTVSALRKFQGFIWGMDDDGGPFSQTLSAFKAILGNSLLLAIEEDNISPEISLAKLITYDRLLRGVLSAQMAELISLIYRLDVYIAVAAVAARNGFCYPEALPSESNRLHISGLRHPGIRNAVGNKLASDTGSNVVFLTGANMAGKSTLMKAAGIAFYLAHMGFPVAADEMVFSVKDGLYSSINVPDNIGLGYSHFYAEILRVKKVAEDVAAGRTLLVIFDELFKGTNVKDAYDATLAISEAFAENRNSFFIISTHITEVGEELRSRCANFQFAYLPTVMEASKPTYSYRLKEGITADRHGMTIIENEGILDLINEIQRSDASPEKLTNTNKIK
ncbi:MutS-related protein [Mucilaginibacter kameinonensis]|uniref:MutS-related protein n=1 Tax=Mucilaginibacter kameinonensis TaxID=452286 RepID=UPI000EF7CFB7|nr:DNA mismatch repair protein [Mucilaginibacter kameinonensis]